MDEKLPRATTEDDSVVAYIESIVNRTVDQQTYSIKLEFNFTDPVNVYVEDKIFKPNLYIKDRAELVDTLKKKYADDPSVRITLEACTTCFSDVVIIDVRGRAA